MFGAEGRDDSPSCTIISQRLLGRAAVIFTLLVVASFGRPVSAETLDQALADAYLINPGLNAERARLRATDEQVALAKAGLRPFISGSADWEVDHSVSREGGVACTVTDITGVVDCAGPDTTTFPHSLSVQLSQPIFQGFQNLNSIREAKATVQAGREGLRSIEQNVLLEATTAYVDVVRDLAVVRLRENDVKVLTEQLKATKDRFAVGEVTRTDVAQAEARLSEAMATLAAAQATLKASRGAYERVVGHPPGNLVPPASIRHLLPATLDEAMTLGDGENPLILTAVYSEEASVYNIQVLMGELLPDVTLNAEYTKSYTGAQPGNWTETTTVTGTVTMPFYQGGGVAASVRAAKEDNNALKKQIEDARLGVHAEVLSQWGALQSSGPAITSAQAAVAANKIALTGVQEEEKVGQRTTLDVLDAQRELLNSQILLVEALRARILAEYSLFAAIGRMDAQTLGLPVPYYDPIEHYDIVKNKWFGLRPPPPPAPDE